MSLKLFGKNAVIYAIGTAGLRATGFLLIPIYTHFLSLSDYGLLATLLLTINFMVTLMDVGLRSGLMRFAKEYSNENKFKYLFGSMVFINLCSGVVVTLIAMFFLQPLFEKVLHTENVSIFILLACLASVTQSLSLNIMSYYRAMNEGLKYMIRNLSVAGLLIISNLFLFVLLDAGIEGALLAYIISYGAVTIVVSFKVFPRIGFGLSKDILTRMVKYSAPLILATGGFTIMETTAAYFLSYFSSLEQVGIYNLGYRIAGISSMIIILPFQLAYEPFLFANLGRPDIKEIISRLATYVTLAFTIIAFFVVFVFRDLISIISPPEYFSSYFIIFLLLPGIALHGFFYVGQSLLHIKNKTNITGSVVFLFSILSITLNYFFIQNWGVTGLLIVYNTIWALMALSFMKAGLSAFPVKLEIKRLIIVTLTFFSLLGFVYLMHDTASFLYYTLVPAAFILIALSFYHGGFLDDKEKYYISKILKNFKLQDYKIVKD
ncbi:MAG: oligosaccharide flippase family protein [Ignavibacteriaceae bacterium]